MTPELIMQAETEIQYAKRNRARIEGYHQELLKKHGGTIPNRCYSSYKKDSKPEFPKKRAVSLAPIPYPLIQLSADPVPSYTDLLNCAITIRASDKLRPKLRLLPVIISNFHFCIRAKGTHLVGKIPWSKPYFLEKTSR